MRFKPGDRIRYHAPDEKRPSDKVVFISHIGSNSIDGGECYFITPKPTSYGFSVQYIPIDEPRLIYWALDKTGVEWVLELL